MFVDIGANLTDPMFRGIYGGTQKHTNDLNLVLERAWKQGVEKMIITVGTLNEADEALKLAKTNGKSSYIQCSSICVKNSTNYIFKAFIKPQIA